MPMERMGGRLRTAPLAFVGLALYVLFLPANAFLAWSADAWFSRAGEPPGLVSPQVDDAVIAPVAYLLVLIQIPPLVLLAAGATIVRALPIAPSQPGIGSAVVSLSALSALFYTLVVAVMRRAARGGAESLWKSYRRGA